MEPEQTTETQTATQEPETTSSEPEATNTQEPETTEPAPSNDTLSDADMQAYYNFEQEQRKEIIDNQDEQTGHIETLLANNGEYWADIKYWMNDIEGTGIAAFNVLLGLLIGYIAVKGFFDSWKAY